MEIEIKKRKYLIEKISLKKQYHLTLKLAPLLFSLLPIATESKKEILDKKLDAFHPFSKAISEMSIADADFCLHALLSGVKRKDEKGLGWFSISENEIFMFEDISLPILFQLAYKSFEVSLKDFFSDLPSTLTDPIKMIGK